MRAASLQGRPGRGCQMRTLTDVDVQLNCSTVADIADTSGKAGRVATRRVEKDGESHAADRSVSRAIGLSSGEARP